MTSPRRRSVIGRPYRRVRRWARHTPNGDIALTLIGVGVGLLFIALIIGVTMA